MQRIQFLNGFHLKLIAICTMFIDHLGYTLFPGDLWLRCVGRVAFPIFCFLIAEGCVYTHDRRKYALRLLAFALLSEIPFNLMNSGAVWDRYHQNVLWTLLVGALVCWLMDWAIKRHTRKAFVIVIIGLLAAFWLIGLAETDYGSDGMMLVVVFYLIKRMRCSSDKKMLHYAIVLALFSIAVMNWNLSIELWSLAALVPIWLYNGQRGFSPKAVQYGFYAFYPVHILVLSLIAMYRY